MKKKKNKTKEVKMRKNKESRLQMNHIPPILLRRYRKMLMFAVLVFIAGIVSMALSVSAWFLTLAMFTLVAAGFLLAAVLFKRSITYNGYFMLEGKIVYMDKAHGVKGEGRPISYHVKDELGNIFQVPVHKKSLIVPIGSIIRVFAPFDVFVYETSGVYKVATIWCYELVSSPEEKMTPSNPSSENIENAE